MPNYLDLFAGAGGLSEGFIQAGYNPIAHVEMDEAACFTLKTRSAYHWLRGNNKIDIYVKYLFGGISRKELYETVPENVLNAVMNYEISEDTLPEIFVRIDTILGGKNLDLIVGGPPCQAYSLVGRARSKNGMVGDKRNYLYKLYAEFLKRYKPKYFVFENVTGLLSAKDEDGTLHFDNMRALFKEYGYSTEYRVLKATDYGVLQNRKRIILIGKLGEKEKGFYPKLATVNTEGVTVSEILKDLPPIHAGEGSYRPIKALEYNGSYLYDMGIKDIDLITFHSARPHTDRDLEIYRLVVETWNKEGKRIDYPDLPEKLRTHHNITAFLDRFKVVAGNLPYSQTVVAHVSRDGHYYIHPDIKQNRSLSPREVARLQTFPDSYYFESKMDIPGRTAAFRQIGNAVPVRLAYTVAAALKDKLDRWDMDVHDKKTRSYNMSRIKSKDTKAEEIVRKFLFSQGFRYRKNDKRLPGKPDIVLPKYRTVIFVNGCFWHKHKGCRYFTWPKSHADFWREKIEENKKRDKQNIKLLRNTGWKVLVIWECELKRDKIEETFRRLCDEIHNISKDKNKRFV